MTRFLHLLYNIEIIIEQQIMDTKKLITYIINSGNPYPDTNHNGKCQNPQIRPTINPDFTGLCFFSNSVSKNPRQPNS